MCPSAYICAPWVPYVPWGVIYAPWGSIMLFGALLCSLGLKCAPFLRNACPTLLCVHAMGLLYVPCGLNYAPWGSFMPPGAQVYALSMCTPSLCIRPLYVYAPPPYACAPPLSCVCLPNRSRPPPKPCTPPPCRVCFLTAVRPVCAP
jgi:hypothetical protein